MKVSNAREGLGAPQEVNDNVGQTKRRPPLPEIEGHGYQTYKLSTGRRTNEGMAQFSGYRRCLRSRFAQQPPPDVKQKVDSLIAKLRDAYVKNDAAAYARAFTSDGILVTLTGKVLRGQREIEQATKMAISSLGGTKDLQVQTEELHALPDGTVWYIGNAKLSVTRKKSKTIIL